MPRRKRNELSWPHAVGDYCYSDVNGSIVSFRAMRDPEVERDLFLAVAQSTLLNFKEIWRAMALIVFPDQRPDGTLHAVPPKIKHLLDEKMIEAKADAELLKLPLSVSEAYAVWARSCDHMYLAADLTRDSDRRKAILEAVAASERRMEERIALHVRRHKERKGAA
jgi:hypothetical protein